MSKRTRTGGYVYMLLAKYDGVWIPVRVFRSKTDIRAVIAQELAAGTYTKDRLNAQRWVPGEYPPTNINEEVGLKL